MNSSIAILHGKTFFVKFVPRRFFVTDCTDKDGLFFRAGCFRQRPGKIPYGPRLFRPTIRFLNRRVAGTAMAGLNGQALVFCCLQKPAERLNEE